MIRIS